LGFIQELKSDKTLEISQEIYLLHVKTQRDGIRTEIDARDLVPGDVVFLNLGDIVQPDLRIIESKDSLCKWIYQITGESYPVKKIYIEIKEDNLPLTKQSQVCYLWDQKYQGDSAKQLSS